MSTNAEVNEIDAEHVLRVVMETIVKYLDIKSITNVANSCTSWRAEALREKEKRFYIQLLRLPYEIGNLDGILDVNPRWSLFICDQMASNILPPHQKLMEDSIMKMPNAIGVGMKKCLTTEDAKFQISKDPNGHRILGLFLPNLERRARVRVACEWFKEPNSELDSGFYEAMTNGLIERLGLNDRERPKSTLLVFESMGYWRHHYVTALLCKRVQPDTEIMVINSYRLVTASSHNESQEGNKFGLLFLNLSGPNIESCTTQILCTASVDEIVNKLQELKKRVKPRRCFTGLLTGYRCRLPDQCSHVDHPAGDDEKMMQMLKDIFPSVPFVGMFQAFTFPVSGRRSMYEWSLTWPTNDMRARLSRDMWIMIISYD